MSIKRDNIILYTPSDKDLREVLDSLNDGPHDHLVRKGSSIVYGMSQFFYYESYDGLYSQWLPYTDELAAEGKWIFNDDDYGHWSKFVEHMMKKFTIKELMTQTIIVQLDW